MTTTFDSRSTSANGASFSSWLAAASLLLATGCSDRSAFDVQDQKPTLAEAYAPYFTIGAALSESQLEGPHADIVTTHFNSISPENLLKWGLVQPQPGEFNWGPVDRFVEFGEANELEIIGHTLIWHSQTPDWVYHDDEGKLLQRDDLLERMRDHIHAVVGRYKGRIHGWDVVNEALNEDGSLRESLFYQIVGEDYIAKAFEYAHEADPETELYYNDYTIENPDKRAGAVRIVKQLQEQGIRITGVGIQEHVSMSWPSKQQLSETIRDFADLGITVMITELDVDVLPSAFQHQGADISLNAELSAELNPFPKGIPDEILQAQAERYADLFSVYLEHKDSITRVTLWGVEDGGSWLNDWPVRGRASYPLLFDRDGKPKPAFHSVLRAASEFRGESAPAY